MALKIEKTLEFIKEQRKKYIDSTEVDEQFEIIEDIIRELARENSHLQEKEKPEPVRGLAERIREAKKKFQTDSFAKNYWCQAKLCELTLDLLAEAFEDKPEPIIEKLALSYLREGKPVQLIDGRIHFPKSIEKPEPEPEIEHFNQLKHPDSYYRPKSEPEEKIEVGDCILIDEPNEKILGILKSYYGFGMGATIITLEGEKDTSTNKKVKLICKHPQAEEEE